jgi:urease accessory protein
MQAAMTTDAALFRILSFLSPGFPTGGFAYSHGIEYAVESGDIADEATLAAWLTDLINHGSGHNDAILLRHAHRAENHTDIAALATACASSAERRAETLAQGAAFIAAAAAWNKSLAANLPRECPYPVAVGAIAARCEISEDAAGIGFLQAWSANLVNAGLRLIPLGQSAGLRILAALEPIALAQAAATRTSTLDDLGSACFLADLASMHHETQYTRLFRT